MPPQISIASRQRALRLDLARIRRLVRHALPLCLAESGPLSPALADLPEIAVSIVSPLAMSRVHVQFMGIAGPTDVITFPYGEIVVCAAAAATNASRYGNSLDDELVLYIIHGLLHLNGFDDLSEPAARRMRSRQAKILNAVRKSG
ncbi:MAG: rRNA maturation RNase YbeY [Terrimicrobiaceae bacterium]|nr:rRNA maturation RNase YbeY [Terrimicrobiaceae bacterium]